jgi:hypothetical protein
MLPRNRYARLMILPLTAVLAAAPCEVTFDDFSAGLKMQAAFADDGNSGGGGDGNSGGDDNGAGNNGNGNGGPGNSGNAGNSDGKGNAGGNAGGLGKGRGDADRASARGSSIELLYPNGMSERLRNGRYEMRDAQGRIIINRRATGSDYVRLRSMSD